MTKLVLALCTLALLSAPAAAASPTDTAVANNPGLQQNCAFNAAFNHRHPAVCGDFDVESVASNGGNQQEAPSG